MAGLKFQYGRYQDGWLDLDSRLNFADQPGPFTLRFFLPETGDANTAKSIALLIGSRLEFAEVARGSFTDVAISAGDDCETAVRIIAENAEEYLEKDRRERGVLLASAFTADGEEIPFRNEPRLHGPWLSVNYCRATVADRMSDISPMMEYFCSPASRRPKLLFVSHDATLTGAPAIILRLLRDFSMSQEYDCYTLLDAGGPRYSDFERLSHCHVLKHSPKRSGWKFEDTEAEIASLIASLSGERPRVALVNSAESRHIGKALSSMGIKVISLVHETASYYSQDVIGDLLINSDKVIYPSQYVRDEAMRYTTDDGGKTSVVGQGLLDDDFGRIDRQAARTALLDDLGIDGDCRVVISCGTMNLRKGIDLFAVTAREFLKSEKPGDPPTYFVWVGGGPIHADTPYFYACMEARIHGFEDRLVFRKETRNVEPYFAGADVFLLTSRADPFPCVIHEAMACGLPVICFDGGGGAKELHKDMGTAVRFGDPAEMAAALRDCLTSPAIDTPARNARRRYILDNWMSQKYYEYFAGLVDSETPPRASSKPSANSGRVILVGDGTCTAESEVLYATASALAGAGAAVEIHRVNYAVQNRVRQNVTSYYPQNETYHNWFGFRGRDLGNLIRQFDQSGGGLLLMSNRLLHALSGIECSPRMAVGSLAASPTYLKDLPPEVARSVALTVCPLRPPPSQRGADVCMLEPSAPRAARGASAGNRLIISLLDADQTPKAALLPLIPAIALLRAKVPGLSVAVLCPPGFGGGPVQEMEQALGLLEFETLAIGHERELEGLAGPGDIFAAVARSVSLPTGILSVAAEGARLLIVSELREHKEFVERNCPGSLVLRAIREDVILPWLQVKPRKASRKTGDDTARNRELIERITAILEKCARGAA